MLIKFPGQLVGFSLVLISKNNAINSTTSTTIETMIIIITNYCTS